MKEKELRKLIRESFEDSDTPLQREEEEFNAPSNQERIKQYAEEISGGAGSLKEALEELFTRNYSDNEIVQITKHLVFYDSTLDEMHGVGHVFKHGNTLGKLPGEVGYRDND